MVVKVDEGGGGYDPGGWLYTPVPEEPIPSSLDQALNMADWLSLGHWALVALDKADGSFNFQEKVQTWLVGDWEHVAVSAAAMRNLQKFCESMAAAINGHTGLLDQHWDGTAWKAAELTLVSHSVAITKAAGMLEIAATGYDDVAQGLYGVAKDVGGLIELLIDLLIAAGISAAATVAGSWTLIGGAIGTAATYYGITKIVDTIRKIIAAIEGAMTLVDAFADSVLALLGSAGDWHVVDIPDPFANRAV